MTIALGETNPAAAEVFFFLPLTADTFTGPGLAGHVFVLGEVKLRLPGGAFFNVPVAQIVEKLDHNGVGFGAYAVQLTSTQTTTAGNVYVKATVSGAQPYEGSETIGQLGGDIPVSTTGAIPFYLPNATDPINGAPVTGHVFTLGEVQVVLPGTNTAIQALVANISEVGGVGNGNGFYELAVNSATRGKAYLYALVSGSQRAVVAATILNATGGGGGAPPVLSNVTPQITFTITPSTPIQFDLTDSDDALGFALPAIINDPNAAPEVVHDWTDFTPLYKKHSTRVAIANGYRYTILRDGGWPVPPTLRLFAVDTTGNVLVV